MTNSTKSPRLSHENIVRNTLTPKPVNLDARESDISDPSLTKEDNLGRLTQILLVAAGIKAIELKQQTLALDEAVCADGLLPALLAGTADDQRWDTDLVTESGALLGYRVSLAPEQNLLDRLLLVHDNIKELMRIGSVSGSDNHILCIDPLLDLRKGITSAVGELSSSLLLQSDNLSVAKDAILVASSQVCHGEQTPKMQ